MQYNGAIHIKVSSPDVWRRFADEDDAGFDLAELADSNRTSFEKWGDEWYVTERDLEGIVMSLSKTLGKDGIIVAQTQCLSVDDNKYCIAYLGANVRYRGYSSRKDVEMISSIGVEDIPGWLNYCDFVVFDQEQEALLRCRIAEIDGYFTEFSTDLKIPDRICLRETSFQKRPETIEKTLAGEEVYFVHAPNTDDPLCVEVMGELGSLGYLPSDVSDQLAPALASKRLQYTARVQEVIPASKRNKHAKSSIVSISIEAEFRDEEVPMKTSVPKIERKGISP